MVVNEGIGFRLLMIGIVFGWFFILVSVGGLRGGIVDGLV